MGKTGEEETITVRHSANHRSSGLMTVNVNAYAYTLKT